MAPLFANLDLEPVRKKSLVYRNVAASVTAAALLFQARCRIEARINWMSSPRSRAAAAAAWVTRQ